MKPGTIFMIGMQNLSFKVLTDAISCLTPKRDSLAVGIQKKAPETLFSGLFCVGSKPDSGWRLPVQAG
jgi:hypothetical protein